MLSKTLQKIYIALPFTYCLSRLTENKNSTPYMKMLIMYFSQPRYHVDLPQIKTSVTSEGLKAFLLLSLRQRSEHQLMVKVIVEK